MATSMNGGGLEPVKALDTLERLYQAATELSVTPGWSPRAAPINVSKPRSAYHPALWRYEQVHTVLEAAGGLIGVELAERRNLVLCNPRSGEDWATTQTLVCAYQMILPGEVAPSHRHSSNAMRFIIDGVGTYSTVSGVKVPMESGDIVLTPGGYYHGHGHEGDAPAYWLDCLDVPLTRLFEINSQQDHPDRYEPITRVTQTSPFRHSRDDIARALDAAKPAPDGRRGPRVTLESHGMASYGLTVERLVSGTKTCRWRSSANRIYAVMAGRGVATVEGQAMAWQRGDALVVPAGYWVEHKAAEDSQLLEISDEPLMKFSNHYVEEFD